MNEIINLDGHITQVMAENGLIDETFAYDRIKHLNHKISVLNKRLDDTKKFCDSLWEQLKDYERI